MLKYSHQTSADVINFLKKNWLINIPQDNELEEYAKKEKSTKLNVMLRFFPENEKVVVWILQKIHKIQNNYAAFSNDDERYRLKNMVLVKQKSGSMQLLCYDPQDVIDYFNYIIPNTFIVPLSEFSDIKHLLFPEASMEDVNKLYIKSDRMQIEEINEIDDNQGVDERISEDSVKVLDKIITTIVFTDASDAHIEVDSNENGVIIFKVRYRRDWILHKDLESSNMEVHQWIVSQIKIKSWLKLDETRIPQDWRLNYAVLWKICSFRVSTKPVVVVDMKRWWESSAEKIVIRKMPDISKISLESLWYNSYSIKQLKEMTSLPNWFNIITWPTWSWKTTLLYALLSEIDLETKNVSTIEDPVEAEIKNVNQTQVLHDIWLNFAKVLRAELRQDPDVIMVWEMRDLETAEIAAESSLTGHLVFSTLHTKSAVSSITRLINMWLPPFIVASSLSYLVAQRLVRKLCTCKVRQNLNESYVSDYINSVINDVKNEEVRKYLQSFIDKAEVFKAGACDKCNRTGYKSRTAIVEVFCVSSNYDELIIKGDINEVEIQDRAEKDWMLTLNQDWLLKVVTGITSIEEIYSAFTSD